MSEKLIKRALKVMEASFKETSGLFNTSELSQNYCRLQLGNKPDENFGIMFLDSHLMLLGFEILFSGSVSEANIYPRVIIRKIIEYNASKIILTHNHPSGNCTPSEADKALTRRINAITREIDCEVIDHIIVSLIDSVAFSSKGIALF